MGFVLLSGFYFGTESDCCGFVNCLLCGWVYLEDLFRECLLCRMLTRLL